MIALRHLPTLLNVDVDKVPLAGFTFFGDYPPRLLTCKLCKGGDGKGPATLP